MRAFTCVCLFATVLVAEEPLPQRAVARLGDHLFYHGPGIRATLSPDGRLVASTAGGYLRHTPTKKPVGYGRDVVIWDATTGQRLREMTVPHAPAEKLRFSPDGKMLAVEYGHREEKGIALFDVDTGGMRPVNPARRGTMFGFTPDGRSLLFQDGRAEPVIQWDLAGDKETRRWKTPVGPDECVKDGERVYETVPTPDAKQLAYLVEVMPVWPKETGGFSHGLHMPNPTILVLADAATGKPLYRKTFEQGRLSNFVFAADGKQFVTTDDRHLIAHETATGEEAFRLDARGTFAFALSPDGRWAMTSTHASQVRLWDVKAGRLAHDLMPGLTYAHVFASWVMQPFSADGGTALVVTRSEFRLFDTATGKERLALGHRSNVTPRFADDGKTLFTTSDELARSWELAAGWPPKLLTEAARTPAEGICGDQPLARSDDGRLVMDRKRSGLALFEAATGRMVRDLADVGSYAGHGAFSRDGTRLLVRRGLRVAGEEIVLCDAATGKTTGDFTIKDAVGELPTISGDGAFVAWVDRANVVRLHDGLTGKLVRTLKPDGSLPAGECNGISLVFSRSGSHLCVTTFKSDAHKTPADIEWVIFPTCVFATATGEEVGRFHANPTTKSRMLEPTCTACSPSGRLFAVAERESGAVRVIDVPRGKVMATLDGHRHGVHSLEFAPDGKTLATGGIDGVVYLWDVVGLAP